MKYILILNNIISRAQMRGKLDNIYQERHHIIPVSEGGTNHFSNLVWLSPEEHYVVHHLMWRILPLKPARRKAWSGMNNMSKNNKEFGVLRRKCSERMKEIMASEEHKERCRQQSFKNSLSAKVQTKRTESLKGYKHSKNTREKMSKARSGKPHSETHKANLTKSITERMRTPEERERYSIKWKENNPMNTINPWEHPTTIKNGKVLQWLFAGVFFKWWANHGREINKNRYCLMLKETGLSSSCSKATAQTCISRFQNGWVPDEDPAWMNFVEITDGRRKPKI